MTELDPGRLIGSYRVVRCIGQGGMGTVYEVEHLDLGVRYALKTFSFDPSDEHAEVLKAKFLEEGKLLARLKHPNLTHVFDLAYDAASESLYFVMDLVTYGDGESYTAEDIDLADVDEELVFKWFRELASALDYIHAEGIVHRDVKPANLLVDKDLNVVLTDFGISHIFGERAKAAVEARTTMVTKTGRGKLVLGTEKYMAPEVAAGEDATPAADAYALGVMTLRWLTGFFYGDNPGALALLSKKKYRWLAVLPRLLAPAERRPEKYADLVRQLKPLAGSDATPPRTARRVDERRTLVRATLASLLVTGFVGAAGWLGWQAWQRYEADRKANADRLAAIQRQMEERKRPVQVTNMVVKVVEREKEVEKKGGGGARTVASEVTREEKREQTKVENERQTVRPDAPKPEKMVIVKEPEAETKDYGPIPDVAYRWFAGQGNGTPLKVDFQLANGEKIEMLPMKNGVCYMSNDWNDKKARHKVTLTRPFWVSKYCVTTAQWREFDAEFVKDCLPIEKALEGKYPLSKAVTRPQFDAFCKFLTEKYKKQIPEGYVFRLPSEAEWEYAVDNEDTWLRYAQQGKCWLDCTSFDRQLSKETILEVINTCGLDANFWGKDKQWSSWGWSVGGNEGRLFIGGRTLPHAKGICDVQQAHCFLLDKIPRDQSCRIMYADEEVDPLRWRDKNQHARSVVRRCAWNREYWDSHRPHIQHVVLGPDLVREKAWENPRKSVDDDVRIPNRHYAWNPKNVPKMIKKPRELVFKMAEGGDMVFCTIPAGTFNMSNHEGQDKPSRKVTLTRPFWITRDCVTTKQWREYAKYDCEGLVRKVEASFPKNPIYMTFTRPQWDGFCEFLNKRYGHQLPKGYVFRLPTEAEWEWAFIGEKDGDVRRMPSRRFNNADGRFKEEFKELLKKKKLTRSLPFDLRGCVGDGPFRAYVGGRTERTDTFGVRDMVACGWIDVMLFDTYDCEDGLSRTYDSEEVDPIHFAGRLSTRGVFESWGCRPLMGLDDRRAAHLVVGPDIETPLKKKEREPYSDEDFGGKLLSDVITYGGQSSKYEDWRNTLGRFTRMLSRENLMERILDERQYDETFGFHTQNEDSPWIQLNLGKQRTITGIQVDAICVHCYHRALHLRIWWSDDGKVWHEAAKEDQRKHRYRFDFQRKNVKAKFLRIGREPGFMKDWFCLEKILVYGK